MAIKSINSATTRRNAILKLAAMPVGLASTRAMGADGNAKRNKVPKRLLNHGYTAEQVLELARMNTGIYQQSDIDAVGTTYSRVGDNLAEDLSAGDQAAAAKEIRSYASNTVLELYETGDYSDQAKVDMKFMYIAAEQELTTVINSFADGVVGLGAAQAEIRAIYWRLLTSLEQVPTS